MATKKANAETIAETTVEKTPIEKALEVADVEKAPVAKKAAEKTTEKTTEKKPAAKKAAEKKPAAKKAATTKKAPAKKAAEVKVAMTIQFDGKSYSQEELMNIAKDVWQYDLQKDPADLKDVELYVKPEEHTAYYVFNGTEQGSFFI